MGPILETAGLPVRGHSGVPLLPHIKWLAGSLLTQPVGVGAAVVGGGGGDTQACQTLPAIGILLHGCICIYQLVLLGVSRQNKVLDTGCSTRELDQHL